MIKPPFPYFGGKSRIADVAWSAFGDVRVYIEPFCGSAAVLLGRPRWHRIRDEIINDADGFVANFWRCLAQGKHAEIAAHCDWPVNELDLVARHRRLCCMPDKEEFLRRMMSDPDYCDPERAGLWVWGMSVWIGSSWCSGEWWGEHDPRTRGAGLRRPKQPDVACKGVARRVAPLHDRCRVHREKLVEYLGRLADRLRYVLVCCGDWERVVCDAVMSRADGGPIGVFLDPPYAAESGRDPQIYRVEDLSISHRVREWAIETARSRPNVRIVLCGLEGEHEMPPDWRIVRWASSGGLRRPGSRAQTDRFRERLWLSPSCLAGEPSLYDCGGVSG